MVLSQSQLFFQNFPKLSFGIFEEQMLWIAFIVRFGANQNLQLLQVNSQRDEIMANIKQLVILTEQKQKLYRLVGLAGSCLINYERNYQLSQTVYTPE